MEGRNQSPGNVPRSIMGTGHCIDAHVARAQHVRSTNLLRRAPVTKIVQNSMVENPS